MAELVSYAVVEGVAEVVMNRPPVNAINLELARGVIDAYQRAREDKSARAAKSPVAMKLLRDAFVRANDLDYRRSMESVVETMCSLKDNADSKEALREFAEKRAARYA